MLLKTAGIVLKNTRYKDTSIISKIYTRNLGLKTYIINNVHTPKASIKPSLLQPLTLLELVVYQNKIKEIQRIKEARPQPRLNQLHFNIIKSAIGLFIAELLHKSIQEEEANPALYNFAEQFIIYTDEAEANLAVLPLFFTLQLTGYLGFFPQQESNRQQQYFNLQEGNFTDELFQENNQVVPPHTQYLFNLLKAGYPDIPEIKIPKQSRVYLLEKLLNYYQLHIPGFGRLKSLPVLAGLLRED